MVGIWTTVILLNFYDLLAQCSIPDLSVRKVDRKLIQRKRDDTLEMCRLFNSENKRVNNLIKPNEKYAAILNTHGRIKRNIQSANSDAVARAELFVDDIYGDMMENGQPVFYRKREVTETTTPKVVKNEANRRFDFAPAFLTVASTSKSNTLNYNHTSSGETVKTTWSKKWKYGIIPYFIDSKTYDSELSDHIVNAFNYFEKATCIRLQRLRERPTDTDSIQKVEWLYITNPSGIRQCVHSNERKENHGVQMVVFGYDCMSRGEIIHEIMHVLGFAHEHARPDRDQYVTILWDNIKPGYKKYFEIHAENSLTTLPYDYSSILHYPARAFSKNGQATISVQGVEKLGQRDGLSETDIEKISLIFGRDCVDRNRQYLLDTCPTVVKVDTETKQIATNEEIREYFKARLWPFGIVNYKIRDKLEFTIEERENINAVIRHIEKETCIEFRDLSELEQNASAAESDVTDSESNNNNVENKPDFDTSSIGPPSNNIDSLDDAENEIKSDASPVLRVATPVTVSGANATGLKRKRRDIKSPTPKPPSRRHADSILILARSLESGCKCPPPGKPNGNKVLEISTDCFNSVNDLLHLFVHILGLDHQHNMHDRDLYLHIFWSELIPEMREEMSVKLPPAAAVGMAYDYQSVMHYPWLHIKNGRTNIMYPIWNDGWAMGHWQGLSSIDVNKLNLLYFQQCQDRKKVAVQAAPN